ncbi:MAG TPA: ABC-F type ribosomal protection protein [Halanaerobiales bacterium]|nr:ABC-F type ribosomal protection protein [Halanaerobiales bacterium]
MSVLNLHNIEKNYGLTEVLKNFSMTINDKEKIGLIGPNGSGKTTLFKIISGEENYNNGNLSIRNNTSIGYLSQMPDLEEEITLYEELLKVFSDVIEMKDKISGLENEISQLGNKKDKNDSRLNELLKEYSELQHEFEKMGGYSYKSEIKKVAVGLGFSLEELDKKIYTFSGGEKTRLGLVKLLLSKPDLLLLDEPSNHLDIPSIQWLENYLNDYQGAVVIISHDRYFLDNVVTRIVEIKNGKEEIYKGNYSYYLKERKRRYEKRLHEYEVQQKKIKDLKESIKRLKRWGNRSDNPKLHKRAESMKKRLEKMNKLEKPTLGGPKMNLSFNIDEIGGNDVLKIKNISKNFSDENILEDINLDIYRGEKSAIIGKNGTGKSTILKIISGEVSADSGIYKIGKNVRMGYYSQEFDGFNPEDNLISALRRERPMTEGEARNLLAAFLFRNDEVFKKIKDLSGGEKSRLRLLQLMQGDYNFLVLDEPTNHLDLASREVLEKALKQYPGTILVVSHDRYFLNKIIDYTYELENGSLKKYYGNYDYYWKKKKQEKKNETMKKESKANKDNFYYRQKEKQRKERKKEKKKNNLEEKIMKLENEKEELEEKMVDPENLSDHKYLNELKMKYENIEEKLEKLYEKWEKII